VPIDVIGCQAERTRRNETTPRLNRGVLIFKSVPHSLKRERLM
jgi:hypothetical protein